MGNNNSFFGMGPKPPPNGYDGFHRPDNWRLSIINEKPKDATAKRFVVLLSIDVVALWVVLGILRNLSDAKEIIALIVGIAYLAGRAGIIWVKLLAFMGKHNDSIKKGFQSIKQMFRE